MSPNKNESDDRSASRERKLIEAAEGQEFQASPLTVPIEQTAAADVFMPEDAIPGYRIIKEIHRGGQGVVYQAVQEATKRKVAIKVLLEGSYASESAKKRFQREIELVASLQHPNIISIFHSGETRDRRQFFAMDYVRGMPLIQYVRDRKLSLEDALNLFAKVCDGVSYAHQKGVMHRDLKPSNILVDADGEPKVLDFGLAKVLGERELTQVTMTGQVVGTLPYMSPEQISGNPDEIDIRTDVYALGVILYEILTGHYPYPVIGQMAEVLRHIAETPPIPPSRRWRRDSGVSPNPQGRFRPRSKCPIDDDLGTIVLKALAKESDRRYQAVPTMADDIRLYLQGFPISAKKDSTWYVVKKRLTRNATATVVTCCILLLIGSFGIMVGELYGWVREAQEGEAKAVSGIEDVKKDYPEFHRASLAAQRRQMFSWFLREWDADHLNLAREIQAKVPNNTNEYAAMRFLLDQTITPKAILKDLAGHGTSLAYFVSAQRNHKAGRVQEAIDAYEECIRVRGDAWIRSSAEVRLRKLQAESARAERDAPNSS